MKCDLHDEEAMEDVVGPYWEQSVAKHYPTTRFDQLKHYKKRVTRNFIIAQIKRKKVSR